MPTATVDISQPLELTRTNGRTDESLDQHSPCRAKRECQQNRERERPAKRHREQIAQHRAEHQRRALGEVHRARHGVSDVETEREQSVHRAHRESGNERQRQHGLRGDAERGCERNHGLREAGHRRAHDAGADLADTRLAMRDALW